MTIPTDTYRGYRITFDPPPRSVSVAEEEAAQIVMDVLAGLNAKINA